MNAEAKEVKAKAEVETVTMTDGRKVDFTGKRKLLKESFIEDGSVTTVLDFRNGQTRKWTIPPDLVLKCAGHGAEQKLGDETAGLDDVDDMVIAVDELIDRLNTGIDGWTTRREGSGFAGTSVLMRALMEYSGRTAEQIKAFLKDKTQADKNALRRDPKIKPIVDRLEEEKASKATKVDTTALLEGLA